MAGRGGRKRRGSFVFKLGAGTETEVQEVRDNIAILWSLESFESKFSFICWVPLYSVLEL